MFVPLSQIPGHTDVELMQPKHPHGVDELHCVSGERLQKVVAERRRDHGIRSGSLGQNLLAREALIAEARLESPRDWENGRTFELHPVPWIVVRESLHL